MKKIVVSIFALAVASLSLAAQPAAPKGGAPMGFFFGPRSETVEVWPDGAPNAFESPEGTKYTEATLEIYPARNPNGWCVIACPGGGYAMLSDTHEGRDFKEWFNERGFTFCLLEYRMPRGHHDVPLSDVQQAMRIMRERKDLGIEHIGVMGCSAGGHLASTAATHYVDDATKPEFQILFYPVITMDLAYTHRGSYDGLFGENPSQDLVDLYSNEKHVTAETCPALLLLSTDDFLVPVHNSILYYEALVANHVSASMHIYPSGGHGWGFSEKIFKGEFLSEMERWLTTTVMK